LEGDSVQKVFEIGWSLWAPVELKGQGIGVDEYEENRKHSSAEKEREERENVSRSKYITTRNNF